MTLGIVAVILSNTHNTIGIISEPTPTPELSPTPEPSIEDIILIAANKYGVSYVRLLATARCESGLKPYVVGDDGNSMGLFQIHLPSHPSVSQEQALDPYFAADWSARKFSEGAANIWVCYDRMYGRS